VTRPPVPHSWSAPVGALRRRRSRLVGVATALVLAAAAALSGGCTRPPAVSPADTWQIQLSGEADLGIDALVYDLDAYTTSEGAVSRLHRAGRRAICHLAVGISETGRPDAGRIPAALTGLPSADGRGYWLDIRQLDQLAPVLSDRMRLCRDKGFDAVDADAVDGYRQHTGFPLTQADQLAFDRRVLALARALGLGAGELDFAVNVGCPARDGGCSGLAPLVAAGKPVYVAVLDDPRACLAARGDGYQLIIKHPDLGAWQERC